MNDPSPLRVLYVVSLFPCWSETFIVRGRSPAWWRLASTCESCRSSRPSEKLVQPDAERLLPRARHPLPPGPATIARARAFAAHPLMLSSQIARIVMRLARRPLDLAKSLEALARGLEQVDWIRVRSDFIHAHWGTFPSTVAWVLGRLLKTPFGFTCHAHDIFVNNHLLKEKDRIGGGSGHDLALQRRMARHPRHPARA